MVGKTLNIYPPVFSLRGESCVVQLKEETPNKFTMITRRETLVCHCGYLSCYLYTVQWTHNQCPRWSSSVQKIPRTALWIGLSSAVNEGMVFISWETWRHPENDGFTLECGESYLDKRSATTPGITPSHAVNLADIWFEVNVCRVKDTQPATST